MTLNDIIAINRNYILYLTPILSFPITVFMKTVLILMELFCIYLELFCIYLELFCIYLELFCIYLDLNVYILFVL